MAALGVLPSEAQSVQSLKTSSLTDTGESADTLHCLMAHVKLKRRKPISKPQDLSRKWQPQEIETMLRLLNLHGTDFGLIALQMDKTRDQIKRKYILLEERYQIRLNGIFKRQEEKDPGLEKVAQSMAESRGDDMC